MIVFCFPMPDISTDLLISGRQRQRVKSEWLSGPWPKFTNLEINIDNVQDRKGQIFFRFLHASMYLSDMFRMH